jgi:glycogen operon protein
VKDIYWLDATGREMTDEAWKQSVRSLGVLMVGDALDEVDERGRPVRGDTLLMVLNAHHEKVPFSLPSIGPRTVWVRFLDTIAAHVEERAFGGGEAYDLQGRALALFLLRAEPRERRASETPAQPRR